MRDLGTQADDVLAEPLRRIQAELDRLLDSPRLFVERASFAGLLPGDHCADLDACAAAFTAVMAEAAVRDRLQAVERMHIRAARDATRRGVRLAGGAVLVEVGACSAISVAVWIDAWRGLIGNVPEPADRERSPDDGDGEAGATWCVVDGDVADLSELLALACRLVAHLDPACAGMAVDAGCEPFPQRCLPGEEITIRQRRLGDPHRGFEVIECSCRPERAELQHTVALDAVGLAAGALLRITWICPAATAADDPGLLTVYAVGADASLAALAATLHRRFGDRAHRLG